MHTGNKLILSPSCLGNSTAEKCNDFRIDVTQPSNYGINDLNEINIQFLYFFYQGIANFALITTKDVKKNEYGKMDYSESYWSTRFPKL